MGAFDTYEAVARCPQCHDMHWLYGQTGFFLPDFSGLCHRHFTPGVAQKLDFSPAALSTQRMWDGTWWRVREPGDPMRLSLLADFDQLFGCDCGARFGVVLRFDVALGPPPTATLLEITLLDVLTPQVASAVDFAVGDVFWTGAADTYQRELVEAAYAAPRARADRLHQALVRHFTSSPSTAAYPWTSVRGPTRCEACGDVRERSELILLSHPDFPESFFGPSWSGGVLSPGTHVACDCSWLATDVDRGYLVRLRHPVAPEGFRVLGRRSSRGCRCGAGRAAFVLHFAGDLTGLTLSSLSLRVVRNRVDVADVDFAEVPALSREQPAHSLFHHRATAHDETVRQLLADVFRCDG